MKKSNLHTLALLATHPTSIGLATVLFFAACATALILFGVVNTMTLPPTHHHHTIVAELKRLSARMDQSEHQHRAGIDGVGLRLAELHAAVGAMAEAMIGGGGGEGKRGGDGQAETDMKLKTGGEERNDEFVFEDGQPVPPITGEEEEAVLVELAQH